MKKLGIIAILLTMWGCAAPSKHMLAKSDECTAADVLVDAALDKQRKIDPTASGSMEYCRVVPDMQGNKVMGLVIIHRSEGPTELEDAFAVRFYKNDSSEWVMVGTSLIYSGVVLNEIDGGPNGPQVPAPKTK